MHRVLAVGIVLCAVVGPAAAGDRPNLLLLVAEDLSPRIGAFGDAVAVTPHLDQLAQASVRYPNTFTTAGVCAPSRAALITGVHQNTLGAQHMRASSRPAGGYAAVPPAEVKAFPELLRGEGYYTFVTGKLDYQFSSPFLGSGPFTIWDAESGGLFASDLADAPLWREREDGQPFFGMMNFGVTHESGVFRPLGSWPHSPLHLLMQIARASGLGLFSSAGPVLPEHVALPPYYPDTPTVREDVARHYNNVHVMDAQIAAVLAQLEADGLADSTIVVWTTDHGDGLPRAKRELFDSGLQVPMIIRWPDAHRPPGVEPGQIDERMVSFVDLAPSLLALAGADTPSWMHGRKLAVLGGETRTTVHAARDRMDEVPDRQRAVRDARFKLIRSDFPERPGGHRLAFRDNQEIMRELWRLREAGRLDAAQSVWFDAPGRERLFDLAADPHELHDVSADPTYATELARMRVALDAWLARVGDTRAVPEQVVAERSWPGGEQPVTEPPLVSVHADELQLRATTPGSSLGYRVDDGPWQLYRAPVSLPAGAAVVAKAVRYGWAESEEQWPEASD